MQSGSDYTTPYYPHNHTSAIPNPSLDLNPTEFRTNSLPATYASAPPYSQYYSSGYPPAAFSSPYPPYYLNPDPVPSLAPFHAQPHTQMPPYPYDPHQPASNYAAPSNPNPNPHPAYERYDLGSSRMGPDSSSLSGFDDYGRSRSLSTSHVGGSVKIVRALPKVEEQRDVKSGVQKFRVKLLPEGSGQSTIDVLCQIGLNGIRMLDPSTNRTLRIYPLETVTRWDVSASNIYTFWAKSPVDIEPRRIRLQSNSYTTNTILDIVAAATVQLREMGASRSKGTSDAGQSSEQLTEKKKGFVDWINLIKPGNEEKDHWVPDEAVTKCTSCGTDFGAFVRKHHCRNCGDIFCDKCTLGRIALTADEQAQPVRVCDRCMAEVTQRLSNAKETAIKSVGPQSHEDLARKLQEEMDKNRKPSAGSKSDDGSGRRMKEFACPSCTIHLQVQAPSIGSLTVECGVCQHPFIVNFIPPVIVKKKKRSGDPSTKAKPL